MNIFTVLIKRSFSSINLVRSQPAKFVRLYSGLPKTTIKMGDVTKTGVMLADIVSKLEAFASTKLAESWDNVGLLIDPMENKPITKILLTNDLTENVMQEGIDQNVGMIISYHPPIFKGLKALTSSSWKERIVIQCLRNSIALFSPHTSWDIVDGGVNDWLAKSLSPKSSVAITESGCGRMCQLAESITIRDAIAKIKKHTGLPHIRLALAVGKNLGIILGQSVGRTSSPPILMEFCPKNSYQHSKISTMALCAGSGATVLAGIKADLYLTGEMLHHDVLEANHNGANVILLNHSDSERGFLKHFAPILECKLLNNAVHVIVSEKDSDPLKTV